MTQKKYKQLKNEIKGIFVQEPDLMKNLLRETIQELLDEEMKEHLGVTPHERSSERKGYRAGYYSRALITRVGKIELRVLRDRDGKFSTQIFEVV